MNWAFPVSEFYEVRPWEVWKLFSSDHASEMNLRLEGSRMVHLWNESLKSAPFNLNAVLPQRDSYLFQTDINFWKSRAGAPISTQQLALWSKRLSRSKRRNGVADLIPRALTRWILTTMGRRISAGF